MTPDEFRRHGYEVIDWIARYLDEVERYPVLSAVQPGEVRAQLPSRAPEDGEPFEDMLRDVDRILMPGITHWQSPNFFAYFPANHSGPSILGDLLSSGLGVQGMLWATSPACTELETLVLDWLVDMLGLPDAFRSSAAGGGVIQDSASSATLCALLAARERCTGFDSNRRGVTEPLTAYASTQAHSSIEKAMMVAGLGRENLRLIPVDQDFQLRPDLLESAIEADRASGCRPCLVVATVGTTSSGACDPLRAIGPICDRHGLWLHVDAAMYGTAALCPEFRALQDGLEQADSYCFNPHKWMFTNFDCDCFFVADRAALVRTLSVLPEYLKNQATESGAVIDYRDWQVPLGRRFRALKLWFVIRHFGLRGLREKVRGHVRMAQQFARWVDDDPQFERAAPAPLNLVTFRHRAGDTVTEQILAHVNATGRAYLTHTKLDDRFVIRLCVGQTNTQLRHVEQVWHLLREARSSKYPSTKETRMTNDE
jgi:aromatic-L-amino-acid/L-tryptophan decarboxylase